MQQINWAKLLYGHFIQITIVNGFSSKKESQSINQIVLLGAQWDEEVLVWRFWGILIKSGIGEFCVGDLTSFIKNFGLGFYIRFLINFKFKIWPKIKIIQAKITKLLAVDYFWLVDFSFLTVF
jgi:hypothetical protein